MKISRNFARILGMVFAGVAVFTVTLVNPVWSETYFVRQDGSDGNTGTVDSPAGAWKTINKAAGQLKAGDTVYIKEGIYLERVAAQTSGSSDKYITYAAYPGQEGKVIIDAEMKREVCFLVSSKAYIKIRGITMRNSQRVGLYINKSSSIEVDNVEIYGSQAVAGVYVYRSSQVLLNRIYSHHNSMPGQIMHGILIGELCSHVTVRNSRFEHNGTMGVALYANGNLTAIPDDNQVAGKHITIENCVITKNGMQGIWVQRHLYVMLRGNTISQNGASGIQVETAAKNIYVVDNVVYANNTQYDYETGIWLDETVRGVVENNTIYANQKGLYVSQSHQLILRRNKIYNNKSQWTRSSCTNCPTNSMAVGISHGTTGHMGAPRGATFNRFVHNTLFDNGAPISKQGGWMTHPNNSALIHSNRWVNNIVSETTGQREVELKSWNTMEVSDGNIYFNSSRPLKFAYRAENGDLVDYDFSGWKTATGFDARSLTVNPRFTNVATYDLSLLQDSPAINRGDWLAKTLAAGSGTQLRVDDPYVFSDGWDVPGALGDLIQLEGQTQTARVTKINFDTKTLTLSQSLSWRQGQGVAYVYSGNRPDIGAFESGLSQSSDGNDDSSNNGSDSLDMIKSKKTVFKPLEGESGEIQIKDIHQHWTAIVVNRFGHMVRDGLEATPGEEFVTIRWNGRTNTGDLVASGAYTIILQSNSRTFKQKMVVVK